MRMQSQGNSPVISIGIVLGMYIKQNRLKGVMATIGLVR